MLPTSHAFYNANSTKIMRQMEKDALKRELIRRAFDDDLVTSKALVVASTTWERGGGQSHKNEYHDKVRMDWIEKWFGSMTTFLDDQ